MLGLVEATDGQAARAAALTKFKVTDDDCKRLVVRVRGSRQGPTVLLEQRGARPCVVEAVALGVLLHPIWFFVHWALCQSVRREAPGCYFGIRAFHGSLTFSILSNSTLTSCPSTFSTRRI